MKKILLTSTLVAASLVAHAGVKLKTETDKLSYSIGSDLGRNFKQQDIQINPEAFLQGLNDELKGAKTVLTKEEMKQTLAQFQKKMLMKRLAKFQKAANENKKKGEAFLLANKKKKDVVTLPSGLQYKILKKGSGASPKKEDSVTVEYTGKLLSGKVFDSSEKTGKPATFKLTQVIPGWTEALQLMKTGAQWEIYVPSKLAYGSRGIGGPIGPNETLVFNIKLISVKKKSKA